MDNKTKIQLHEQVNDAYIKLLNVGLELNMSRHYYVKLLTQRTFLSQYIDNADLPTTISLEDEK